MGTPSRNNNNMEKLDIESPTSPARFAAEKTNNTSDILKDVLCGLAFTAVLIIVLFVFSSLRPTSGLEVTNNVITSANTHKPVEVQRFTHTSDIAMHARAYGMPALQDLTSVQGRQNGVMFKMTITGSRVSRDGGTVTLFGNRGQELVVTQSVDSKYKTTIGSVLIDTDESIRTRPSTSVELPEGGRRGDYYAPWEKGTQGSGGYEREIPARFAAGDDDIFMRSMIANYAMEGKDCDEDPKGKPINCHPTGAFSMNQAQMMAAAREVLATHKGLTGDALKTYLDTYFAKAWGHFDVNKSGSIEVIKAPQFMRFLASDQRLSLGENGF